jgi:thiamine-monophosphate kinase
VRLKDLGEAGLLNLLHQFCPTEVIGDDAALFAPPAGRELVITTDVLVEGVHFSSSPLSPLPQTTMNADDVGWRAVAANYSDLAAMGAQPLGITVGLGLPPELPVQWVQQMYEGIAELLHTYGGVIWGGDVVRSSVVFISITAVGCTDGFVIKRSVAQPGDWIVVTGDHGLSRAGLAALTGEVEQTIPEFIRAHRRPHPRLDVVPVLHSLGVSRVAGMDSSDGLADAVAQICRASGVGAVLRQDIAIHPLLKATCAQQAWEWFWYGGEDFELVLTLPPEPAQALVQRLGHPAQVIGEIIPGEHVVWGETALPARGGFQHFDAPI